MTRLAVMCCAIAALCFGAPRAARAGAGAARADAPVRAVMLIRTSQVMPDVLRAFEARYGAGRLDLVIATDEGDPAILQGARVIFVEHGNAETLPRWKPAVAAAVRAGAHVYSDLPDNVRRLWDVPIDAARNEQLLAYWNYGGDANLLAMLAWIYRDGRGANARDANGRDANGSVASGHAGTSAGGAPQIAVPDAVPELREGAYHPRAPRLFPTLADYLAWYRTAKPDRANAPLVGLFFFHSNIKSRDLAHVDALLDALERQGMAAVGIFGWPFATLGRVLDTGDAGRSLRLILSFNLALTRPDDVPALTRRGLHVISLMTTRESYATWAESPRGVTPDRLSSQVNAPETAGATEPIMVATSETIAGAPLPKTTPIAERVEMVARRARRWLTLQDKPNADKRVVMLYYNNPPGKGNIGASYLNLPPSIVAAIEELRRAGYDVGEKTSDAATLLALLEQSGRNVELWAPGEMTRLVKDGRVTLVPMEQYRQWFAALPARFRAFVVDRWGPPEKSTLMTYEDERGRRSFVLPGIQLGHLFLGPQLLRASFAEYTNVQHSGTIPPPHAYIAAYLWCRQQFKADAIVHMGRHGTLEWLPGKNAGQAGWDSSEVLLGDLPNVNYYILDGDGEALQARRRSAAVLISHLTPMLVSGGHQSQFDALNKALDDYNMVKDASPVLAEQHRVTMLAEIKRLDLDTQLRLGGLPFEQVAERVHTFLESVEDGPIPMGLPTLGQLPREEVQREALAHLLLSGFDKADAARLAPRVPAWVDAIFAGRPLEGVGGVDRVERADGVDYVAGVDHVGDARLREKVRTALAEAEIWLRNLRESAPRELASLTAVLAGDYLPSGPAGDPLRTPASLPSGRNLHGMDPSLIPTRAAWEVGRKLGAQFLARFRQEHGGRDPEHISMVLWHGETTRHQGAMESEALWLMGVEPIWNPRGVPDQLRLVPDSELDHPRVDVLFTVSGLYRDGFADKIQMLDRAARLVAAAGDNAISRQNRRTAETLRAAGVTPDEAASLAQGRVFGAAPGAYGFGLQQVVEQSKDVNNARGMADLYLNRMNFVFTADAWGRQVPRLLESQLAGNEAVIHSRSSNLYGVTDNDDFYQFVGGLNLVSREINGGVAPDLFLNNLRAGGRERVEDVRTALVTELTARNWNPKWIREMQQAGYSGAREMTRAIEFLYGWQATAPEIVDETLWQQAYDVYVADKNGLELEPFFDRQGPHAYQALVARLLEIDRQGRHRFTEAERGRLVQQYVRSVNAHGAACSANTCGNVALHAYVMGQAGQASGLISGLGDLDWRAFGQRMAASTGWTARQFPTAPLAAKAGMASVREARPAPASAEREVAAKPKPTPAPAAQSRAASQKPDTPPAAMTAMVNGFRMAETTVTLPGPASAAGPRAAVLTFVVIWAFLLAGTARELTRWRRP